MRKFFVTRHDWEVGPIFEVQFQQMIDQSWFRPGDLIRTGDAGIWRPAEQVVPPAGFGSDADEVILLDEDDEELDRRPPPVPTPFMLEEQQRPDALPGWFRSKRHATHYPAEDVDDDNTDANASGDTLAPGRRHHPQEIQWIADDDDEPSPPARRPARQTSTPESFDELRFQTAEFQVPEGYQPPLLDEEFPARSPQTPPQSAPRETDRGPRKRGSPHSHDDHRDRHHHDDEDEGSSHEDSPRSKARRPTKPRARFAPPSPMPPSVNPANSGELLLPDTFSLDADSEHEAELLGTSGREAPPLPSMGQAKALYAFADDDENEGKPHDLLPPTKSSQPGAVSGEIDFSKVASLAADDPAISHSQLPTYVPPPPLLTPEERAIRSMVTTSRFTDTLNWLLTGVGVQACLISIVVNGLVYAAFKRLFILAMEVFIPFEGSSEALGEENLAIAGVAMLCSIALPVLPLVYIIKIDGRVVEYSITLFLAMFAAVFINTTEGGTPAMVLTLLFLALPAAATAVLSGAVTAFAEDTQSRMYAVAGATLAGATTAMVCFAAPSFGIVNELPAFPPVMYVSSPHSAAVILLYGLQCVPIYLILQRLAGMLLDRSTQEMVSEHFVFHGILTVVGMVIVTLVHSQAVTGWFAIPAILASLTVIIASGFNLWSLTTHFIPQLDRLHREHDRFAS